VLVLNRQCVRIAPKRYQALLEWGAVLVQALNALPSPVAQAHRPSHDASHRHAPPLSLLSARPSALSQQGRVPPLMRGPSSTASLAPPPLPSWVRDDERDDAYDENDAPPQPAGFSFGGGGHSGSSHADTGGKASVPAESWAEIYRKQRASRRSGAVK
jgi:hypothetical protein